MTSTRLIGCSTTSADRGAALIDAVATWGRRTGATVLILQVVEGNTAAIRRYQRLGFVDRGRVPETAGEPIERVMTLDLTAT